tara:strand:- start:569 stop:835 length:267 start_codon:yes stop_codon:yes gene_type:complete
LLAVDAYKQGCGHSLAFSRNFGDVLGMLGYTQSTNNALTCEFERVRRIELPSSAWKAEVLAVELHPQLITMLQVGVYPEVQIRHNHDV